MADGFSVTFRTEEQKKAFSVFCKDLKRQGIKPVDYFRQHILFKAKRIKGAK